jgi:D-alanyl-lipoteichoic acid acyltransferase DltB (MBOAT superfamily)
MKNFNMPYLAHNVSEFWKRWHISLSTWFRDYVYIPLGGSRVAFPLICVNLLIVFTVSGLWHGANWKYLIWGLIHGLLLIIYQSLKKLKLEIKGFTFIKWLITFNLVCLAWIFFRADTVADACYIIGKIFTGAYTYSANYLMPVKAIAYCAIIISGLMAGEWYMRNATTFSNRKKILFVLGLAAACYLFGVFTEAQFIYFQF